jgi:exodeoxyribonuclease-3
MRIATWNVNSIRTRLDRVIDYLVTRQVDVLALQETKVKDEDFPLQPFHDAGWEVVHWGVNQWNGVAIASRVGLDSPQSGFDGQPEWKPQGADAAVEPRALGATCGGVRVWSLYVPHGRGQDDPHMQYKLAWLAALERQATTWAQADDDAQIALMGDWNVAPLDTDVWDIKAFEGATHVSPAERAAFAAFEKAGYREVTREHLPEERAYTQWDYQAGRFHKNEGVRIDFAWCTPTLADLVTSVEIVRDERKGKGASDHVPVELALQE